MRVLLVEDEADVRRYFVRALANLQPGLEIVEAADGREALDYFLNEPFDLVLSDQRMPFMTGLELLRAVRAVSSVPFLIISADRSAEREAFAAGVNEYLSKPISLVALRAVVARYL
jgi:CheY-like chemotaxis protein